jgi:hypothetical protein
MEKNPTIFCDIDGTLFIYRNFESLSTTPAVVIDSVATYLRKEKVKGAVIVITTARPEYLRSFTEIEIQVNNIPFDQLVMGIGRGERILINDSDEGSTEPRAIAYPLIRDKGF